MVIRTDHTPSVSPARRLRAAPLLIALTLAACAGALWFRAPLRARYWAWRITHTGNAAEQVSHLNLLLQAGADAHWGIIALLDQPNAAFRQYGALALQRLSAPWARQQLLRLLADRDATVREMAALGLALQGDPAVIPTLCAMYQANDTEAALYACVALERLGTAEAVAALAGLAAQPADAERRAMVIDALEAIGTTDARQRSSCAKPLLALLADHRSCTAPPRAVRLAQQALQNAQTQLSLPHSALPTIMASSAPATDAAAHTVAERAARALAHLTGLNPSFSSEASMEERQQAERQWSEWCAAQNNNP